MPSVALEPSESPQIALKVSLEAELFERKKCCRGKDWEWQGKVERLEAGI
jgi:hypothetical protein